MDDVLLNKVAIIERCLNRIQEEYQGSKDQLETNYTKQDSIILNLLRAAEASIDSAMHVVRVKQLGVPQQSREAFTLLEDNALLDTNLSQHMQAMVGFRDIAVHNYQNISLPILKSILENNLVDFEEFSRIMIAINS